MTTRRLSIAACAAFALVMAAGCQFSFQVNVLIGRAEREFAVSTPFENVGSLDIDWIGGEMTIRIDETADEITASGMLKATASSDDDAEDALDDVEIVFDVAESQPLQVTLRADRPDDIAAIVTADVEIVIPGGLTLNVGNTSGDVLIDGNEGETSVVVINGAIEILDQAGTAVAEATNGRVEVTSLSGRVEARSLNGSIEVTARPEIDEPILASTTNGQVSIFVPSDTAANLSLRTITGSFSFDLENFEVSDLNVEFTRLMATLNGGGTDISGETINGSVTFGSVE